MRQNRIDVSRGVQVCSFERNKELVPPLVDDKEDLIRLSDHTFAWCLGEDVIFYRWSYF